MTNTTNAVSAVMVGDHHMRITCPNGALLLPMHSIMSGPGVVLFDGSITLGRGYQNTIMVPAKLFSEPGQAADLFNQITNLIGEFASSNPVPPQPVGCMPAQFGHPSASQFSL